jgi:hypothetical protein
VSSHQKLSSFSSFVLIRGNFFSSLHPPSWLVEIDRLFLSVTANVNKAVSVVVFVLVGVAGLYLTRGWVRRMHRVDHSHNDIVGYYLAAVTVFYGITSGLLAIGTWTTYADVQTKVKIVAAEAYRSFNDLVESRRAG